MFGTRIRHTGLLHLIAYETQSSLHLFSGPVHSYQFKESNSSFRVSGVLFHFYSISNTRYSCYQTVETLIRWSGSALFATNETLGLRFKYTTKFSLPKIACPAIVYAEIVVVIDPFFVGVCPWIKVYHYNPTEICQQRLQRVRNVAQKLCSWERSLTWVNEVSVWLQEVETRGPLVMYRSPECWVYLKISVYWGKDV